MGKKVSQQKCIKHTCSNKPQQVNYSLSQVLQFIKYLLSFEKIMPTVCPHASSVRGILATKIYKVAIKLKSKITSKFSVQLL